MKQWLDRKKQINQIEASAGVVALETWADVLKDCDVIHFIDNNGALGALVKGSASVHQQDLIMGETWSRIARLRVSAWFDRVDSSSNPVDGLSRKNFSGVWQWRKIFFPQSLLSLLKSSRLSGLSVCLGLIRARATVSTLHIQVWML